MFTLGCERNGWNFSHSTEVEVPADVLWETVCDLEALPQVVSMVTGFERVSGNPPAVGTRFRETREFKGREFIMQKTVTRLEDNDPEERCLSLGISVKNSDGKVHDVVNTSTLIVQEIDDKTSRLTLTGAFQSNSFLDKLNYFFCYCCFKRMIEATTFQEVEDYRVAAIERNHRRQISSA